MMEAERIGNAFVLRAGAGEWYNQPERGLWDMGEDVADIPPARWHQEVNAAINSLDWHPSLLVIDATGMTYLVGQDYGFLFALSKRLRRVGIALTVIARANEVRAFSITPASWNEHIGIVGTLEEALKRLDVSESEAL